MAVERFILDQSQLDDVDFGLGGGFSPAFTLDTSTLDSIAKLDGFTLPQLLPLRLRLVG